MCQNVWLVYPVFGSHGDVCCCPGKPYSPMADVLRLLAIPAIADKKKKKLATALQNSVSGVA